MNLRYPVFLIVLTVFSSVSMADEADLVLVCADCNEVQASWVAARAAPINASIHVYIADFKSEQLRRFQSKSVIDGGNSILEASPSSVASDVQAAFNHWINVKDVIEHVVIDAPTGVEIGSAYELVGNSRAQWLIGNYIFDNKAKILNFPDGVVSPSASFIAFAASEYFSAHKKAQIKVTFPDESYAIFELQFPKMVDKTTVEIVYETESATDSDGNRIPQSVDSLSYSSGSLLVSDAQGDNVTKWKERVRALGFVFEGIEELEDNSNCTYWCGLHECQLDCEKIN